MGGGGRETSEFGSSGVEMLWKGNEAMVSTRLWFK